MLERELVCSIVGLRDVSSLPEDMQKHQQAGAMHAGRMAIEAGFSVMTGGRGGTMSYAAMGAKEAREEILSRYEQTSQAIIAVLPEPDHATCIDPDLYTLVLPTCFSWGRNLLTATMCDVMIAFPGTNGTVQEMTLAQDFGRPVVQIGRWYRQSPTIEAISLGEVAEWLRSNYRKLHGLKDE